MEPRIKRNRQATCHRDGTASFWSVYRQQWVREVAALIEDRELAAMGSDERRRVIMHATNPLFTFSIAC